MTQPTYVKAERVYLRRHPEFSERWVQARIVEDPTVLGLGDLIVKDEERIQPGAGRLDMLLQDSEANTRYEVELQLGATDESHIIRTIEYWDIERKRYPQYEHIAVLVAEDVTSRFLNVIGLFNGVIPLIAIQMNAIKLRDSISLVFTTVLDQRLFGPIGEDEEDEEVTDRAYWEKRGTPATVKMADELLGIIREFDDTVELKYNKFYIGLSRDGRPANYALFRAQKQAIRLELRLKRDDEIEERIENAGLDVMEYSTRTRRYRLRLVKGDIPKHRELLADILRQAYEEYGVDA